MNKTNYRTRRGVLLLETLASTSMIILLVGALAWVLVEYSNHVHVLRTRVRAAAAAESVLNEIRAGVTDDAIGFHERFKGLALQVDRQPGGNDWSGMTKVIVRVRSAEAGESARPLAELAGYVAEGAP